MEMKEFKFIELPKEEAMLSEEKQSLLLGGINCGIFDGERCKVYSDGPCTGYGSCGGDFYCADYS